MCDGVKVEMFALVMPSGSNSGDLERSGQAQWEIDKGRRDNYHDLMKISLILVSYE